MAYSNAIFHLDHYNGSDTARTALTGCIASNPSGSVTRITKTGHGLVTGAVVTLSLFTAWLNGAWKITVVNADSFDLDDAVWQATADANGTVTPFGGSSWADAWKTYNTGVTAARAKAGDKVKVCETPAPVSIGNATWTNGSEIVTLAAALTKTITNCENNWTAAANVTPTLITSPKKQGSYAVKLTIAAGFTTGKIAYYTLPATLDLSAYQELCFWYLEQYAMADNRIVIKLCSDATGDVVVDEFVVYKYMQSHYTGYNIPRTGGGNLGAAINSIAIYATTDPGTTYIQLDNIFAATTGGLNLTSLISKNGAAQAGTEPYYLIGYIDETTIGIANHPESHVAAWYGYPGTTETVTTYKRVPYTIFAAAINANQVHNTVNNDNIEFEYGYNITTGLLTGETFYSTYNGMGIFMQIRTGTKISGYVSLASFWNSISTISTAAEQANIKIHSIIANVNYGITLAAFDRSYFEVKFAVGLAGVYELNGCNGNTLKIDYCLSSRGEMVHFTANSLSEHNEIYFTTYENPTSYAVYFAGSYNKVYGGNIVADSDSGSKGLIYVWNGTNSIFATASNRTSPVYFSDRETNAQVNWIDRNGTGLHEVFKKYSLLKWQTTEKYQSETGALEIEFPIGGAAFFTEAYPRKHFICDVSFDAGTQVTITVPIKKSASTYPQIQLVVGKNPIIGINNDIKTLKDDNTDWELVTVQFTPTSKGVVKVSVYIWILAGGAVSYAYIGKPIATQA